MKITRRTKVFIKTERKFSARQQSAGEPVNCQQCAEQMIPAQTSADFFGISSRLIYRWIETGKIHFIETDANEIYVCSDSINGVLNAIR